MSKKASLFAAVRAWLGHVEPEAPCLQRPETQRASSLGGEFVSAQSGPSPSDGQTLPAHRTLFVVAIHGTEVNGAIELLGTPDGHRLRFVSTGAEPEPVEVVVKIHTPSGSGHELLLPLLWQARGTFHQVAESPSPPQEFLAQLRVLVDAHYEEFEFGMSEPPPPQD